MLRGFGQQISDCGIKTGPSSLTSRLVLQSVGKILVATSTATWAGTTVGSLVRLYADGSRDTVFGTEIARLAI
jgi:hypothetical protein